MYKSTEISRSVWSSDGRYLVMAHAKFRERLAACGVRVAKAVVHVFEGDPVLTGASAIFYSFSELHSGDLLDELQNAERIGRDFLASTRI
jgi:hypothetical protein